MIPAGIPKPRVRDSFIALPRVLARDSAVAMEALMGDIIRVEDEPLPALIDKAANRLRSARTSAEVFEARQLANLAMHHARLVNAANETRADCLRIIITAENRLADETDAAQKRGELAKPGQRANNRSPVISELEDLGIPQQRLVEWRTVRDAGQATVNRVLAAAVTENRAPTKAEILEAARVFQRERTVEKQVQRDARLAAMTERTQRAQQALATTAPIYNVIVIDPPWWFDVHSRKTGLERSFENHYEPMTIAEIEALRIPAAPDCVVCLWATVPRMADAYRILTTSWGLDYVTTITWNKRTRDMAGVKRGLGYVARNTTEHLIVGTQGAPPWAVPGEQWGSGFDAPATGHSTKPDEPYDFLSEQFPHCPKLGSPHDLFRIVR
jgi:N6-adenosine-specific RNA methylase IME4